MFFFVFALKILFVAWKRIVHLSSFIFTTKLVDVSLCLVLTGKKENFFLIHWLVLVSSSFIIQLFSWLISWEKKKALSLVSTEKTRTQHRYRKRKRGQDKSWSIEVFSVEILHGKDKYSSWSIGVVTRHVCWIK